MSCTTVVVLRNLWLTGVVNSHTMGVLIHILQAIGVMIILVNLISGGPSV